MRLIDIAAENIDVQELRQKLFAACRDKLDNKANWAKTRNGIVCCHFGKRLILADDNFMPLQIFESTSNIASSGISREGNYAVCLLAYNQNNDEDSGAMVLLDVQQRRVIKQKEIELGCVYARVVAVYEPAKNIVIHLANTCFGDKYNLAVQYDFDLCADERTLKEYYQKAACSSYELNSRVKKLLADMQCGIEENTEKEIWELLTRIGSDLKMSEYQLSLTYKELGSMYEKNGLGGKAIAAYKIALDLNPKITVKKSLHKLQKEVGEGVCDYSIPYPQIIEKKRALAADDYTLPSTYDADWRKKRSDYLSDKADNIRERQKRLGNYPDIELDLHFEEQSGFAVQTNVDGLQTEAARFVAGFNDLNDMSDTDFNTLFNDLCKPLDDVMIREARKLAEQKIGKQNLRGGAFTVREEILMDLYNMLKVCNKS